MLRGGLIEKVKFEQRLEGGKGIRSMAIRGSVFLAAGINRCAQALRWECVRHTQGKTAAGDEVERYWM